MSSRPLQERSEEVAAEAIELARSEELRHLFKADEPSWFDGINLDWLPDWAWLDGSIAGYVMWGALALFVIWGVVQLVRAFLGKQSSVLEEVPEQERRLLIAEQLTTAARYREAGELSLALRHYWSALIVGLGRGRAVAYRPAWTCREMLARSKPGTKDYELLHELLPRIERLEFGRVPIEPADVDELAAICSERLSGELAREGGVR